MAIKTTSMMSFAPVRFLHKINRGRDLLLPVSSLDSKRVGQVCPTLLRLVFYLSIDPLAADARCYAGGRQLFVKKLKTIKHWLLVGTHQKPLFNSSILSDKDIHVNITSIL
jgi:hypothetical protein